MSHIPDFDGPTSAPSSFSVQPHGIHAVYGSHPVAHTSSGANVYGSSLERGFDYESVSRCIHCPVAAMIPTRRTSRDWYNREVVSPSGGRNICHRKNSSSRTGCSNSCVRGSNSLNRCNRSRSQSQSDDGNSLSSDSDIRDDKEVDSARAREGFLQNELCDRPVIEPKVQDSRQHARSYSVSSDSMPLVLPHLEWRAKVNGPLGFTIENLLLDNACPFVLIHADLVNSLGLSRRRLHQPQQMSLAMSSSSNETFAAHDYCKVQIDDPSLSWYSHTIRALIVPSLCAPMILGLPFLSQNNLVIDYNCRTVIDKFSGFDLLHPIPSTPCPLPMNPKERRAQLLLTQQDVLEQKQLCFVELIAFFADNKSFRCFTRLEFPTRGFDMVAAVRARIEDLENQERLDKMSDKFKMDYADVFTPIAHTSSLPDNITCKITLKEAYLVIQSRGYASPWKFKDAWSILIQQHLDAGRIHPSNSPYSSPAFLIPKADPSALPHWVNDFQKVNANTVPD